MNEIYRKTQTPCLPEIGAKKVSILDFGAASNGIERIDTALYAAMDALGTEGGTICFPAGTYLTGPVQFRSHLEIHLEKGATVLFSRKLEDYLPPVLGVYEGIRCYRPSAMLHAEKKTDLAITGEGVLDGQGDAWWDMVQYTAGPKHMMASAEKGEAPEKRVYSTWTDGVRPCFLEFLDCRRVLLEGITFRNSPFWTVHPTWCEELTVRNIRIDNPMQDRFHHSPNTDGINMDGCRNALVEGCTIYCGDDCVCMKSGKNRDGREAGHTCENVEVRNCHFLRGIGGITIGSEMSGGCRNLYAHDIDMKDICLGIWMKGTPERGGFIDHMTYENISIEAACCAGFQITLGYDAKEMNGQFVPKIHDITAANVTMTDGKAGIVMEGLPGYEPHDILLENITMKAELPIKMEYVKNVSFQNVSLDKTEEYIQRM